METSVKVHNPSHEPSRHVILVHGTYGHGFWRSLFWDLVPSKRQPKDCNWPICKRLKDSAVKVHSFTWSGRNSHRRCIEAGRELANYIADLEKRDSQPTSISIVGHSHGGNVALYSLKHSGIEKVDSIVCLATPFLHFSAQELDFIALRFLPFVVGIITCLVVGLVILFLLASLKMDIPSYVIPYVILGIGVIAYIIAFPTGRAVHRMLSRLRARLERLPEVCQSYQPAIPTRQRVLILRKIGDEATAFLVAGRLVEWLLTCTWRVLSCPMRLADAPFAKRLVDRVRQPKGRARPKWVWRIVTVAIIVACFALIPPLMSRYPNIRPYVDLYNTSFEALVWVMLGLVGAILLLCVVQCFFLFIAIGLNLVRFGVVEGLGPTFFVQVNVEPTPLGLWELELFSAKGFAHSEIHEDPLVADRAAMWLLANDTAHSRTRMADG
jgi:PGAP1-like protein